jgi:hypothetical protein
LLIICTVVARALSIAGNDTCTGMLYLTDDAANVDFSVEAPNPAAGIRQQITAGRGATGFGATWTGRGS